MKHWLFALLLVSLGLLIMGLGQVPQMREWRIDGILVRDNGTLRSLGLTAEDMESLIYRIDEIPGFECRPNPFNDLHTIIGLNGNGDKPRGWLRSHISRGWTNVIGDLLKVEVRVYDKPASEYETYHTYRWGTQVLPKLGSFSGLPLGEECFTYGQTTIWFRQGRVVSVVSLLLQGRSPEQTDSLFAEALSWGIEYCILQHPKKLGMAKKPMTVLVGNQPVAQGKAVALAGVTVAPISSLSSAKVSLKTERDKKEWAVTASLNGRRVKVKAFSWEMETEKGKVKLERPVFPYGGELIVPLRQVAEALGIRVQQKGETIALLP